MKKLLLCALLLCALLLAACAAPGSAATVVTPEPSAEPTLESTPAPTPAPTPEPEPEPTPEPPEPDGEAYKTVDPEAFVVAELDLEGEYDDDVGNDYLYVYRIPAFSSESDDARHLSQQMWETVYPKLEEDLRHVQELDGLSLLCLRADYAVYQAHGVVSVVETLETDWGFTDYCVMSLDAETGREADRALLLERFGLSEEEFLQKAVAAADSCFKQMYLDIPEETFQKYGGPELLSKTTDVRNFGPGLQLFVGSDGRLSFVAPIFSFAGAEYYYHILSI
ncbi:MAG: hypothetical protein K6G17_07805 [Oscillospiraceae bacterium]|nr:hypothetical protein [Oscillospiraceae bacterium]